MRKGNLVKLNPAMCFTVKNGGEREYPMDATYNDDAGVVEGRRHLTEAEVDLWYSHPHRGLNDAGETSLPPRGMIVLMHKDDILIVEQARCRVSFSYHGPTGGWAKLLNTESGESFYVKRDLLKVIS